jgi:rubrerythrin
MVTFYKMQPIVMDKLQFLLLSLKKARRAYEQMAFTLKNKQLRLTIIGLAQESRQYATELDSYVTTLGLETEKIQTDLEFSEEYSSERKEWICLEEDKDILHWCAKSEKSILKVYRDVLNEPFLNDGIRKMMRYQLNGMMHSFAQMKLLYASLRTA